MGDRLFHYTCADGARGIDRDGVLAPHAHPWIGVPLVWLTDLDTPWRDALGLTSHDLTCDRTAVRYEVADGSSCIRWATWARANLDPATRRTIEYDAPGLRPGHWWVCPGPVPVLSRVEVMARG
jgi:hypothetical protein